MRLHDHILGKPQMTKCHPSGCGGSQSNTAPRIGSTWSFPQTVDQPQPGGRLWVCG